MSVCICIFFLAKKKTETKLKLTVSELRELFECKLFFIIIINMKKKKRTLESEDWLICESNAVLLNTEQKRGNTMQKQGSKM